METPSPKIRLDKWLWAVRLYKTRSLATKACEAGHVLVNGDLIKPARPVRLGDLIRARTGDITRTYKVTGFVEKRVGAPLVPDYAEDLTPPEEFARAREVRFNPIAMRPKGTGRPTKKERRDIEHLLD